MSESAARVIARAWEISARLKAANIAHEIKGYRQDAISIVAVVPGQYWEIDCCESGSVDVEVFASQGVEEHPMQAIDRLIETNTEPQGSKE